MLNVQGVGLKINSLHSTGLKTVKMTNKVQRLIEKCSQVSPLEGRILVSPERVRTYKQEQTFRDDEASAGSNPVTDEQKTKTTIVDVNYRYQKAVVLKTYEGEDRFTVGDTIIYGIGALDEFDLFKGVSILRKYDVVAVVEA